jgi:acid phosphatase family membrane protein YuiD
MVSSGGMPSSHSACAMGLATSIGLHEGPGSPLFAMCMVFAGVVSDYKHLSPRVSFRGSRFCNLQIFEDAS